MSNYLDFITSEVRMTNVISEQHDTSKIDWEAGMNDPSEMAGRGVKAALRRANLDTSTGKVAVMVAGKAPWHRLGVNVANAVSSKEASVLASLNWTVSKRPLSFDHNGVMTEQSDAYAIVRDDTGACLGIVGSRYTPIQNDEGFAFLDDVLGEFGAKYETAGSIHGGKKVWMLANLPESCFEVANGDRVETYAIFSNPHDGLGKAYCYPSTTRVVCGNTFRVSTKDKGKGIGIRHSGSMKGKIDSAKTALGLSVAGFKTFANNAEALTRVRVPSVNAYVNAVLDDVLPLSAVDAAKGAEGLARHRMVQDISLDEFEYAVKVAGKEIQSRGEMLEDILNRFESERCNVNGIGGTVWSAFNAVTEAADYTPLKRKQGSAEAQENRRFESVLDGDRDELKQVAYSQALTFVR